MTESTQQEQQQEPEQQQQSTAEELTSLYGAIIRDTVTLYDYYKYEFAISFFTTYGFTIRAHNPPGTQNADDIYRLVPFVTTWADFCNEGLAITSVAKRNEQ
jgi:hypothetical protein